MKRSWLSIDLFLRLWTTDPFQKWTVILSVKGQKAIKGARSLFKKKTTSCEQQYVPFIFDHVLHCSSLLTPTLLFKSEQNLTRKKGATQKIVNNLILILPDRI